MRRMGRPGWSSKPQTDPGILLITAIITIVIIVLVVLTT